MNKDELELSQAVLDCMAGAAQLRSALVAKVASLQDENDRLRRNAIDGGTVKRIDLEKWYASTTRDGGFVTLGLSQA